MRFTTAVLFAEYAPPGTCQFGITEGLSLFLASTAVEGGIGAETAGVLGGVGAGAIEGGAGGAALSGVTGGDPLTGALGGALTGGAVGGAGALGLGTAGQAAAGAAGGALGSGATGGDPLQGAIGGVAAGVGAGLTGSSGGGTSIAPSSGAGGAGSAASAAGPAAAASVTPDLTSGAGTAGFGGSAGPGSSGTTTTAGGVSPATGTPAPQGGGGVSDSGTTAMGLDPTYGGKYWDVGGGGTSGGSGGFFDKVGNWIEKNPGAALGAGALGLNMLMGPSTSPQQGALGAAAAEDASVGRTLTAHALSGNLPPGAQTAVDQATNAAKAKVRSSYASMGLSGSTMEAQAIQQVDQSAASQTYAMAQDLLKQGANFDQMSAQIYESLLKIQMQQDQNFSNAIATFAKGLAGSTGGGGGSSTA